MAIFTTQMTTHSRKMRLDLEHQFNNCIRHNCKPTVFEIIAGRDRELFFTANCKNESCGKLTTASDDLIKVWNKWNPKLKGLVVNNYGEHGGDKNYGDLIHDGIKTIETRMGRMFTWRGAVVICIGKNNSVTDNKGMAICIVDLYNAMPMLKEHEEAACIEWHPDRRSHLLRNWRHFSRDFLFAPQALQKNFQGMFDITIPEDVQIIPQPKILSFEEKIKP